LNELTLDHLRHHRIVRTPERRIAPLTIYLLNISNSGMMAEYRVRIGEFRVYVKILNLQMKSKFESLCIDLPVDSPIGLPVKSPIYSGAFGTILEKRVATHKFVTKLQRRDIQKQEIEDVVREIAISKLCSMLRIGPAVEISIPFDVVIYTDPMQFHLEKCEPLRK
jgi:hypothetical protein